MQGIKFLLPLLLVIFSAPLSVLAVAPTHPVIIVPTVLGSLPSEDGPVVDPIFHTYDNLIDTFVANGYVEDESLFVFAYDWEQSNITSASQLKQQIADAIAACGCGSSADIIGHGQGGLVAWQYLTSAEYQSDINQLIFLGTPFGGIPASYLASEGGVFRLHSNFTGRALGQALLSAEARDTGSANTFAYVQAQAPAFSQLLPVFTDYLFSVGTSYPTGYPTNPFLENLLGAGFGSVAMLNVAADTNASDSSIEGFFTTPSTEPPLWPHGEPTSIDLVFGGDRVVPREAIENWVAVDQFFNLADHTSLPTAAQSFLFESLTGVAPATTVTNSYPVSCMLFLSATAGSDMQITDPNSNRLGKDFTTGDVFNEIPNSFYSGYNADTEYGIIVNPINGAYDVQVEGTASTVATIDAAAACGVEDPFTTSTSTPITPDEVVGFTLTTATSTNTITFSPPLDDQPPVITIQNPVAGQTYLDTDEVFIEATIEDLEFSPIVETHYFFNGDEVNPADPLPLQSAPLGSSTVMVSATDAFNNTGQASVEFIVAEPPPQDTGAPIVTIQSPIEGNTYLKNQSVLIEATIEDPEGSAIDSTEYLFNGGSVNPLSPLPFSGAPLGSASVSVIATDSFGNEGSSTVNFFLDNAPPVTTSLNSTADSYIRNGAPNTNEGASPILRVQGAGNNRVLVQFSPSDIAAAIAGGSLLSASLEFEIEEAKNNWGKEGREIVAHRLLMGWSEGNGKNAELTGPNSFRGTGAGVTWNCAIDTNINNQQPNCTAVNDWEMRLKKHGDFSAPWVEEATDGLFIQKKQEGVVAFDVTADVQAYLSGEQNFGWIIRKALEPRAGYVSFFSDETGKGPKLILTYLPE